MSRAFKSSRTQFNTFIGVAIFAAIATIAVFMLLNTVILMLPIFAVLWAVFAFWGKDRVLITLHDDYIEAKEAIAAKKKLIKYKDIANAELHKSGKIIKLLVSDNGKEKKVNINLNPIIKEERKELFELINFNITKAVI